MTRLVDAARVRPGDLVRFLGAVHRISAIRPYSHPAFGEAWAIAIEEETGWSIALVPGCALEVIA